MAKPTRLTQDMIDDYIARGIWDRDSISDILRKNAGLYPDKEAVVDSETRLTTAPARQRWRKCRRCKNKPDLIFTTRLLFQSLVYR